MVQGTLGQHDFPIAVVKAFETVGGTLAPVIELPDEINLGSIGRPFTEDPPASGGVMQAIIVVGVGKLHKVARATSELGDLVHSILVATVDGFTVRLQPRVIVDDCKILFLSHIAQFYVGDDYKGTPLATIIDFFSSTFSTICPKTIANRWGFLRKKDEKMMVYRKKH